MKKYFYTAKPTLVIKKLKSGAKLRADLEELQLIQHTENARIFYDPEKGILVETENLQGMEEIEILFKNKNLPLLYEGENLFVEVYE
jgi:hypothetical protein